MSTVKIVTDSMNSLPKELIKEYEVEVIPFLMTVGKKVYRDEIDITTEQVLEMLPKLDKIPTMSGANPGEIVQIFTKLSPQTKQILCIVTSKAFSVTYLSAERALDLVKDLYPGLRIEILDSRACSGSLGFIALEAARAAQKGASLEEVIKVAQDMIPRVKHYTGMHGLKYLIHAGRAPKSGLPGQSENEPLETKNVISVNTSNGQIEFVGQYPNLDKALEAMIHNAKLRLTPGKEMHFMAHYSDDIQVAETLKKMALSNFKCAECYITQFTGVTVCATGPQYGIAFYS
jgi:DegV family protein with EDD domain